jgi:hypothetical protein
VVFVKEVVPRIAIARMARRLYNENFVRHPMRFEFATPEPDGARPSSVEYGWTTPTFHHHIRAEFRGEPRLPEPESGEEFIAEHYWGYSVLRDGSTCEYRVDHPPWRVWPATAAEFKCDARNFYGPAFESALGGPPASAFVAEGSAVTVYRGNPLVD